MAATDIVDGNGMDFEQEREEFSQRVAIVPCFGEKNSAENRSPGLYRK